MASLYITEDYAVLCKDHKRLVVKKDDKILLELPEFKIERILLFGKIQVTADAIEFLLENNIDVSFFNQYGRLKGKLVHSKSKNIYLRIAQYESYNDEEKRLKIGRSFVKGKISNYISFLYRYQRNHPEVSFEKEIATLENCLVLLENKKHISGILGIEGVASSVYFKTFPQLIINQGWKDVFCGRTKHPPKDEINSLLSLGYSLVTAELWALLEGIGFEPFVGFLHEVDYGRPSLAIDLLEEFRTAVVERVVLELINHKVISRDDFEETPQGCRMKKEQLKKFFEYFDRKLNATFIDLETQQQTTYRKTFYTQAQKLAKAIYTGTEYQPFKIL